MTVLDGHSSVTQLSLFKSSMNFYQPYLLPNWSERGFIILLQDISPDATAILIPETAHCANMYPERDEDPPQLKQARVTVTIL